MVTYLGICEFRSQRIRFRIKLIFPLKSVVFCFKMSVIPMFNTFDMEDIKFSKLIKPRSDDYRYVFLKINDKPQSYFRMIDVKDLKIFSQDGGNTVFFKLNESDNNQISNVIEKIQKIYPDDAVVPPCKDNLTKFKLSEHFCKFYKKKGDHAHIINMGELKKITKLINPEYLLYDLIFTPGFIMYGPEYPSPGIHLNMDIKLCLLKFNYDRVIRDRLATLLEYKSLTDNKDYALPIELWILIWEFTNLDLLKDGVTKEKINEYKF